MSRLGKAGDSVRFPTDIEDLYHVTTADRLPSIAENGLVPGLPSRWQSDLARWSSGKVFFTMDEFAAGVFVREEMDREFSRNEEIQVPVVLRIHRKALRGAKEDMQWFNVYVERAVKPELLEAWIPWKKDWVSLDEAVPEFEGITFGQIRGEKSFEKLKQDYFKKDWFKQWD